MRDELSWNISTLLRSKILGLFVNTLSVNNKSYCHYRENFAQSIQIQLSKKPETFSNFHCVSKIYITFGACF